MQTHKSSCLAGPSPRIRARWQQTECSPATEKAQALPEVAPEDEPEFRADLVARVRRQIAEGTYGTQEQFEIAFDRLMRFLDEAG